MIWLTAIELLSDRVGVDTPRTFLDPYDLTHRQPLGFVNPAVFVKDFRASFADEFCDARVHCPLSITTLHDYEFGRAKEVASPVFDLHTRLYPSAKYHAMIIHDLFERQMVKRIPLLDRLEPHRNDADVFVTFVDNLKLGIHPTSQWTDPTGIYAYPVREMFGQFSEKRAPFAGQRKYAYIFRNTGNMLELDQMTDNDIYDFVEIIEDRFADVLMAPTANITDPVAYWQHAIESWIRRFAGSCPGECFWEVTRKIALHIESRSAGRDMRMIWNRLFRECGFDAVSDRGLDIISINEPAQAVFLNTRAIQPIEAALNDLYGPIPRELPKRPKQ